MGDLEDEKCPEQGWTPVLVLKHLRALLTEFDRRIHERFLGVEIRFVTVERATQIAMDAAKEATQKAEREIQKEFDNVRQRQDRFEALAQTHVTKTEYTAAHAGIAEKIDTLTTRFERSEGTEKGAHTTITQIVAGLAVLIAVGGLVVDLIFGFRR